MLEIIEKIRERAAENAAAPAVCGTAGVMTYGELLERVAIVSNRLEERSAPRLATTYINIKNLNLRFIASVASLHYGLVPMTIFNLDRARSRPEVDFVIGARESVLPELPADLVLNLETMRGAGADRTLREFAPRQEDEPFLIGNTTGTTGLRKVVRNTYGRALRRGRIAAEFDFSETDRVMSTVGTATSYGFTYTYRVVEKGACLVRPAPDPDLCLKFINAFRVNRLHTTPARIARLMDSMERHAVRCPDIRSITLTGSLFPRALVQRIDRHFETEIRVVYGSSEVGGIASDRIDPESFRMGYVGRLLPGVTLLSEPIADTVSCRLQLVNKDDLLSSDYVDGRFEPNTSPVYTLPDIGRVEDGRLFLDGRDDEVLNHSGIKVAFSRIEEALLALPEVRDAALVNVTPARGGIGVAAALVVEAGTDPADAWRRATASLNLAGSERAVAFTLLDEIPRNDMGKIIRPAIVARAFDNTPGDTA